MFYSKIANITNRSNLEYATAIYGTPVDVYFPVANETIRSDYDLVQYSGTPGFTGKILLTSVFKAKFTNLSSLTFIPIDDENSSFSIQEFPISSLIVIRNDQLVQNYQIHNIQKTVDHDVTYFYKYVLVPYTYENRMINEPELIETLDVSPEITDLSVLVSEADIKLTNSENMHLSTDKKTGRGMFTRKILETEP